MEKILLEKNKWKNQNEQYLFELQKFLDLVDNIENKDLKKLVINQMLKCDKCLTNIAENIFKNLENKTTFLEDKWKK